MMPTATIAHVEDCLRDPCDICDDITQRDLAIVIKATRSALRDALDLAEEGWAYAADYFTDKWDSQGRIAALRRILEATPRKTLLDAHAEAVDKQEA